MDPCWDFLSICGKIIPRFHNFAHESDYGDAFINDTLVFLRCIDDEIGIMHYLQNLEKCVITVHFKQAMSIMLQLQTIKFGSQDYFL